MAETLYKKPALLNRETGKGRKIAPTTSYAYARELDSLYLAGAEFVEACKHYPIVFIRAGGKVVPAAMLGLREGENLYVDAAGDWDAAYVPAYVRRYPFVLAALDGQQMGVCIDEAYEGLNLTEGESLFDEDGNNTPFLQTAVDFLSSYQVEATRTERFCQRLQDWDLLVEMNARADLPDRTSFLVNGLMIIDAGKLKQLDDGRALEIFRLGELNWAFSHLISLSNMNDLVSRLAARKASAFNPDLN